MRRPPLSQLKALWRDQCFEDIELTYAAFKLAYGLADFITMSESAEKYRDKGKLIIWPSQAEIRRKTNLNPDTISLGVNQLIERGHLIRIRRGNQFRGSNKYRLLVRNRLAGTEST